MKDLVGSKSTDEIAVQTLNIVVKSHKPLAYSSYSNKLFPELIRNYSKWQQVSDLDYLKREISKSWSKIKKENKIITPKEADRVIVENAVKTLGGKR